MPVVSGSVPGFCDHEAAREEYSKRNSNVSEGNGNRPSDNIPRKRDLAAQNFGTMSEIG